MQSIYEPQTSQGGEARAAPYSNRRRSLAALWPKKRQRPTHSSTRTAQNDVFADPSSTKPTGPVATFPPGSFNQCLSCNVRDNDPRVVYDGPWVLNGTFFSTTHSTTAINSTVTLKFNATGILVFGTVPASNATHPPPSALFAIDDDDPVERTLSRAAVDVPNQGLFVASGLAPNVEHRLFINVTEAKTPFSVSSFFLSIPGLSGPPQASTSTVPTPVHTLGSDYTTYLQQDTTPTATFTSDGNSPDEIAFRAQNTVIKVLAGILATIIILMVGTAVLFFYLRRRVKVTPTEDIETKSTKTSTDIIKSRPETLFTSFTSPSSILRNDVWSDYAPASRSSPSNRTSRTRSDFRTERFRRSDISNVNERSRSLASMRELSTKHLPPLPPPKPLPPHVEPSSPTPSTASSSRPLFP